MLRYNSLPLLLLAFIIFSQACESPKAPTFTRRLAFPLQNKIFDVTDIDIQGDSSIDIRGDSVFVSFKQKQSFTMKDRVKINPLNVSRAISFEENLILADSLTRGFSLGDIGDDGIDALHGTNSVIPAFVFNAVEKLYDFPTFASTDVVDGLISVTVSNSSQIDMSTLTVDLRNPFDNGLIGTVNFSDLVSGSGDTSLVVLSSFNDLEDPISVILAGTTVESETVTVDTSLNVDVKLRFVSLSSRIQGTYPPQVVTGGDSVASSINSVISEAKIKSGMLNAQIENIDFDALGTVIVKFPDFTDDQQNVLTQTIQIPTQGMTSAAAPIDMSAYTFRPGGASFGNQFVRYTWEINLPASTSDMTEVTSSQAINVDLNLDEMILATFSGTLEEFQIDADLVTLSTELPEGLDSIKIQSAFFELKANNPYGFPVRFDLLIEGRNGSLNETVVLGGTLDPALQPGVPVQTKVRTNPDQNVIDLVELPPTSVSYLWTFFIGDDMTNGFLDEADSVTASLAIVSPLIYQFPDDSNANIIRADPNSVDIPAQIEEIIQEQTGTVLLTGSIINHFPSKVSIRFLLDSIPDNLRLYENISQREFVLPDTALIVQEPPISPDGFVIQERVTNFEFILTPDDYGDVFDSSIFPDLYSGLHLRLFGTQGQFVKVRASDFLEIRSQIQVEVLVNQELFE